MKERERESEEKERMREEKRDYLKKVPISAPVIFKKSTPSQVNLVENEKKIIFHC